MSAVYTSAGLFDQMNAEDWLVNRLRELRCEIPPGAEPLKVRCRAAVIEQGYAMAVVGRKPGGGAELVEDAFARVFGEPLQSSSKRRSRK